MLRLHGTCNSPAVPASWSGGLLHAPGLHSPEGLRYVVKYAFLTDCITPLFMFQASTQQPCHMCRMTSTWTTLTRPGSRCTACTLSPVAQARAHSSECSPDTKRCNDDLIFQHAIVALIKSCHKRKRDCWLNSLYSSLWAGLRTLGSQRKRLVTSVWCLQRHETLDPARQASKSTQPRLHSSGSLGLLTLQVRQCVAYTAKAALGWHLQWGITPWVHWAGTDRDTVTGIIQLVPCAALMCAQALWLTSATGPACALLQTGAGMRLLW